MTDWQTPAAIAVVALSAGVLWRGPLTALVRRKRAGACDCGDKRGGCH